MILVTHDDPTWRSLQRQVNGAETYSRSIGQLDGQQWRQAGVDALVVSSCPRLCTINPADYTMPENPVAVQYLHTFCHKAPLHYVKKIIAKMQFKARRVIFITAYRAYADLLRANGYEAYFMPMCINLGQVMQHEQPKEITDRIIWFGNIYSGRRAIYAEVAAAVQAVGMGIDTISAGLYNGQPVTQQQAWGIISKYRYGIGVGRCALEMTALGVRVLIAGMRFGGIMPTQQDYQVQSLSNFGGRQVTYDYNIGHCINAMRSIPDSHWADHRNAMHNDVCTRPDIINQIIATL